MFVALHCIKGKDFLFFLKQAFLPVLLLLVAGCSKKSETVFTLLDPAETGITFVNTIEENNAFNILTYEYLYNGGGVAAGDLNNDGLTDLFFTGNSAANKLYLNQGNWRFEDITEKAGVEGKTKWKTGVTFVDINDDGLLDIYICSSGPGTDQDRCNELYINQGGGSPVFVENARQYGLDACGTYSTQASFFDYDKDGDLDMFLLNHARLTYNPFFNTRKLRSLRHPQYGNKLFRNEAGKFSDVSEQAGIHGSAVNFGLGISASDVNQDGWVDIYVTNDYEEQDFFYLNQGDGTFREVLKQSVRHISRNGMGSDIADYNNDGRPDIIVVDMLPEDNYRQKILKGPDEFDKYNLLRDSGYHHQNMRNVLQLNLGNTSGKVPLFSEIGQLAGISNTDWSWAPLFFDFDHDGLKDVLITNGFLRDFTNLDFIKYGYGDYNRNNSRYDNSRNLLAVVKQLPSTKIANYIFRNRGDLTFDNVTAAWGFTERSVSSGAAYADLDNDGDLDVAINNINEHAFIYRNNTDGKNHYLKIKLRGDGENTFAIGSKVWVKTDTLVQMQELFVTRGFQSSVTEELNFGLGKRDHVEAIQVQWPDGEMTILENIPADTTVVLHKRNSALVAMTRPEGDRRTWFEECRPAGVSFVHRENEFVDFKVQYLLPYQVSRYGPCLTSADVDQDGQDDFYVGGASGQPGALYVMTGYNSFRRVAVQSLQVDSLQEDTGALFFDADGDDDQDLYVVSGGTAFKPAQAALLQDRLYLNEGNGVFKGSVGSIPREISNGSCVVAADYDRDGDQDLFVGGRTVPGNYPLPSRSYLFRNDTEGEVVRFSDVTPVALKTPGIVNSAVWTDYNNDTWPDLIIAGEFMPVMLFENTTGTLTDKTRDAGLLNTNGLWCKLIGADIDQDGDEDLIAGNAGLNTAFKVTHKTPLTIYAGDFNQDGIIDPIVSSYTGGIQYPNPSRDELLEQLPHLKTKFTKYETYASADIHDVLNKEQMDNALLCKAYVLYSAIIENLGNGKFRLSPLPVEAQFSMISGIVWDDFTSDGLEDILLAGNFFPYRVQLGRNDAGSGLLLRGNGRGKFTPMLYDDTGFYATGDIRSMNLLKRRKNERYIILGVNDDNIRFFRVLENKILQ